MLGLAALVVLLAVLAHWLHRRLTRPFRGLLEVFAPLPVIGTLHIELHSKSRPFVAAEVAEAHFAKYGGRRLWTEWLPVMGRFLVVADQREAERLLKAMGSPESLLMRHRLVHNNYQAVFLTATQNSWGDDWAWRRKVLAPHFVGNRLQSAAVFPAIQEEVDTLLAELDQAATTGKPIELPLFFSQFTLRVMMRVFLGAPLEADLKNVQRWLEDHADCFIARVALPSFLTGKQEKTKQASQEAFKKLLMPELRAAMAEGRGIAGQAAQREPRFADEETLFSEALGLIFAGFETSGNSMALLFSNLIVRPQEIELLREEISANSPIDSSVSAAKLVRLNACFNESMRLWPPTVVNLFDVERSGSILGVDVEPGDQVLISHYACSRDPEVFPAPEEFRLERFLISPESLRDNPDAVKDAPQMAFSYGQHQCLGKNLAFLEVRLASAKILEQFNFRFADPKYEPGYHYSRHMVPHPNRNCPVIVSKR